MARNLSLWDVWREGCSRVYRLLSPVKPHFHGWTLRDYYTVWAKAGWYPKDGTNSEATVDAGVVFSDCGPYIFVVMSDAPEDFDALFPLEDALNAAHGRMCGGSTKLAYTSSTTLPGTE